MSVKRRIFWILFICVLYVIVLACTIVTYAYFSKKEIYDGYFSGQVELLFDRLSDTGIPAYQKALNAEYAEEGAAAPTVDKNKTWGSEAYPFVISNVRHLYNLSELQRLGYFHKKFILQNAEGEYSNVPYFLVCTPQYTPVLIDGTSFKNITAIGTDDYPFIGSVKGVQSAALNVDVKGKTCDTSVIHNVTVAGNPNNVDVGLFGVIGYLGTEPQSPTVQQPDGTTVPATFEGQTSTVSNLVLSDIQVVVNSSVWDNVISFVEDIMINAADGHLYSFSELHGTDDYNKVSHENHHIGILAGHAGYATIEFISVYYSSDNIVAMDLRDTTNVGGTKANYLSSTGILGFIDNINPKITIGADGKQTITSGSGDSMGDISYGSVGGGGLASGEKAGYVLASEMYNKFHFTKNSDTLTEDASGTILLKDALDENGNALCTEWVRDRILWGTQNTGRYYFYDGVFTFALSDQTDKIEPTWNIVTDESGNSAYDIPDFSIGQDDPTKWKMNTQKGNNSVVAYVKDIKTEAELQTALSANKKIYIGYESDTNVNLMSLYKDFSTSGAINANDNYTTAALSKTFIKEEENISSIEETLKYAQQYGELVQGMLPRDNNNHVNTDIINNIRSYRLINLGSAEDIQKIRDEYPINAVGSNGSYTFQSSTSGCWLALLAVDGWFTGYRYSIFTGKTKATYWGGDTYWEQNASVAFNDDGTVYIRYDYTSSNGSETAYRYVYYNSNAFKGTTSQNATGTKLKFYVVEGTSNLNFGRITYDPIDDPANETDSYTFSAGTHVLKATSIHTKDGNNIATTTTSYTVVPLATEGDIQGLDWNNGVGSTLSQDDLLKKFKMTKGITFGASFNLFNGTLGSSGIITAPVGTDGVEANIPMACVAFKINKPVDAAKIRVILSVAVSEFYPGETDGNLLKYDLGDYTRYFNLWKMEAAGESIVQIFNATGSNLLDRFEVPRSHPYEPSTSAAEAQHLTVKYNNEDYRCYLNGDRVLVAYEFTVNTTDAGTGTGVYCLGMSGINPDGSVKGDVPMEIVYFSADGVASSGRDGATGSQIGTIDFVYDYSDENVSKIVTVTESSSTDENGKENYNTYYPSYCLLYFDHKADNYTSDNPRYVDVNNEVVIIRRYVDTTADSDVNHNDTPSLSTLEYKLESNGRAGDGRVKVVQYSRVADNIRQDGVVLNE